MGEQDGEIGHPAMGPAWTYWCPHEGTHVIDPSELHVGIVHTDDAGVSHPLFVFAIVPSIPVDDGLSQNEVAARLICDALAWGPWNVPDGPAAWFHAHGFLVPFPPEGPPASEVTLSGGRST